MKCRFWRRIIVTLSLGLATNCSQADIDVTEYATSQAVRTERERQALQGGFAEARRQAAEQAAELEAQAALRLAEEQARLAARPYPIRMIDARCRKCHTDQNYLLARHALPGWWFVVLRMRYLNRAELSWQEMWVIARHLSANNSAGLLVALYEWSIPPLTGLLLWSAFARWHRRHKLNRTKENKS